MNDSNAAISLRASSLIFVLISVPVSSSPMVGSSLELEFELFLELAVELAPEPSSPMEPVPLDDPVVVVVMSLL